MHGAHEVAERQGGLLCLGGELAGGGEHQRLDLAVEVSYWQSASEIMEVLPVLLCA